jgi:predicted transposase YbfD/YdcC
MPTRPGCRGSLDLGTSLLFRKSSCSAVSTPSGQSGQDLLPRCAINVRKPVALGASNRPASDEFDDKPGRLARRRVIACPQAVLLEPLRDWLGLRTVVAVESIRSINGSGKVEAEIRYFLSSCTDAPEMLAKAIRQHWSIENSLHWVLDVTFREDDRRPQFRLDAKDRHQPGPTTYQLKEQLARTTKNSRMEPVHAPGPHRHFSCVTLRTTVCC